MGLTQALHHVTELERALTEELAHALEARALLRALDAGGLFEWASQRERRQQALVTRELELLEELKVAALAQGQPKIELRELCAAHGAEGSRLESALSALRATASRVREAQQLTQVLLERSSQHLRSLLRATGAERATYDRRGSRPAAPPDLTASVSQRA